MDYEKLNKLEEEVREVWLNQSSIRKYANNCCQSGWIIIEPEEIKNRLGQPMTTFLIHKIYKSKSSRLSCYTVSEKVMEQLKSIKEPTFVATIGRITENYKHRVMYMIEEMQIIERIKDKELLKVEEK